jgi:hypothetical protein
VITTSDVSTATDGFVGAIADIGTSREKPIRRI